MRRRLITVSVGLAALVVAPTYAQDASDLLAEGRRAYEREEFDAARAALWEYLDATSDLTGAERLPQAEALYYIARMEPDAAIARQHYEIIVDEFAAATVADRALHRLGMLDLSSGDTAAARERFETLQRAYPFSQLQPELPLWIGRTHLQEGDPATAATTFEEGFRRVRSQDLPRELPRAQREALAAEYAHWLANAYYTAGDEQTAAQYYTLLTLDYPQSPQAAEARETLATIGGRELGNPIVETPAIEAPPAEGAEIEVAVSDPSRDAPRDAGPPVVAPPVEPEVADPPQRDEAAPVTDEGPAKFAPPAAEPQPEEQPTGEPRYIQVGAFENASRAADLSKRLKADGFENTKIEIAIVDGRGFYRVRVGPFRQGVDDEQRAEAIRALEEQGYPAALVTGE